MYRVILFDLDGTLTASGEGITKCVQYALAKSGVDEPDLKKLEVFVGPPLIEQFMSFGGLTYEQSLKAVDWYRERYSTTGIYENYPYEGIQKLLEKLKSQGYILGVASSKPEVYVLEVLNYFHLDSYFSVVVGSELNGERIEKADVIQEALRRLGLEGSTEGIIMVGDKKHDVIGARKCGLPCIAVGYGYGSYEELSMSDPFLYAPTVQDVQDFFALSL